MTTTSTGSESRELIGPPERESREGAAEDGRALIDAAAYLEEFASVTHGVAAEYRESRLASVARCCVEAGVPSLAQRMVEDSGGVVRRDRLNVLSARATLAEAAGGGEAAAELYSEAAEGWRRFGNPCEEAEALLGRSRCADEPAADRRGRDLLRQLRVSTA